MSLSKKREASLQDFKQAVDIIRQGGIVAYPTEGVYGLGCDPNNEQALQRLIQLKRRDPNKGLILIAASLEQAQPYIKPLLPQHLQLILNSENTTWVAPASRLLSSQVTGNRDKVAIRITKHPQAKALCTHFGSAIVSTSANKEGQQPATTADAVNAIFNDDLDYILFGTIGKLGKATRIIDLISGDIIRP